MEHLKGQIWKKVVVGYGSGPQQLKGRIRIRIKVKGRILIRNKVESNIGLHTALRFFTFILLFLRAILPYADLFEFRRVLTLAVWYN